MTCPRCGREGYIEKSRRGNTTYIYFVHQRMENGKRIREKCYLGALKYRNVEKFQNLDLAGLADKERFKRYVRKLIDLLDEKDLELIREMIDRRLKK